MKARTRIVVVAAGLSIALPCATPILAASSSQPQGQTSPGGRVPASARTTDLAPQLAADHKATAIIRHPDGAYETFLVAPTQVDAFIRNLGRDVLVTLVPPQSLVRHAPPQVLPRSGVVRHPETGAAPTPPTPPHHLQ